MARVADSPARMQLKAWTVGMRATTKHGAGTPAALGEKHEQTPLIVTGYWSEGGPDRFQQGRAKGATFQLCDSLSQQLLSLDLGIDDRDKAFMQRLRNLAQEALTWAHLGERQRLVWAAALELDAVPLQDHLQGLEFTGISSWGVNLCLLFFRHFRQLLDLCLQSRIGYEFAASCCSFFQGRYTCACVLLQQELPPWFLERQNITRRYPGQS